MSNNVDWYDYDKQEVTGVPSGYCLVSYDSDCKETFVVGTDSEGDAVFEAGDEFLTSDSYLSITSFNSFRPLDWNKNQKKPVDLSWLVDSGIDCEFSDDGVLWYVAPLREIKKDAITRYDYGEDQDFWKQCRPRMNHPMVLTQEQVDLIPDGFLIEEKKYDECTHIITFMGLIAGYCWPWEVNND